MLVKLRVVDFGVKTLQTWFDCRGCLHLDLRSFGFVEAPTAVLDLVPPSCAALMQNLTPVLLLKLKELSPIFLYHFVLLTVFSLPLRQFYVQRP